MLTRMTDADWEIAVEAFRAARSRRGDKGRDDRKFLEALHYFTLHNITWRALPPEFGPWNSVWKRFWRLREVVVFKAFATRRDGGPNALAPVVEHENAGATVARLIGPVHRDPLNF